MWAIAKVITFTLNLIVSTYVMNESKDHSLLLNVLTIIITLIMDMEVALLYCLTSLKSLTLLRFILSFCKGICGWS